MPILDSVKTHDVQVLVVDSNSPDGTGGIVQDLLARYSRLHLLTEASRSGLGGAYVLGMRYAIDHLGAQVLMEFDADLSHDPAKIPEFLDWFKLGKDFVIGTRYTNGGGIPPEWGLHRKFLSVIGNRVIRACLGARGVTDFTGGYRAIDRQHFLALEKELRQHRGYTFQTAFLDKALNNGARVAEVPFVFRDRAAGKSKLRLGDVRDVLAYLMGGLGRRLAALAHSEGGRAAKMMGVGAIGIGVHIVALRLLVERAGLNPSLANLLAAQAAILSNFAGNELWTFSDALRRGHIFGRYLRFVAVSMLGVVLIQTTSVLLGTLLFGRHAYLIAWLVGTGLLFIWNYVFARRLVWRMDERRGAPAVSGG